MLCTFAFEGFLVPLHTPCDCVVHVKPTGAQKPVHGTEIAVVIGDAHMLEHSNRRNFIELTIKLCIGFDVDGNPVFEPCLFNPLSGQRRLCLRQ